MLAFAGVTSRSLAAVELAGKSFSRDQLFLTDSRVDLRCDGAGVFGADGALLGIYSSERVAREVREPKLEGPDDLVAAPFLPAPAGAVASRCAGVLRVSAKAGSEKLVVRGAAPHGGVVGSAWAIHALTRGSTISR